MPLQATSGAASYDAFGGGVPVVTNYIEDVFQTWLYTGTGASQTITNGIDLSTKGGLTWIKGRSGATGHRLTDTARGVTKSLASETTAAEATETTGLTAFGTTGFTIGADTDYNTSAATYVSWTFREQPKFFDVLTYTGNGNNRQIAHNLGSVPGFIIIKRTDSTSDWTCYHRSLGNTTAILLNTTAASFNTFGSWDSTTPTSTEFTLGVNATVNSNGGTYVAYLFAHDAGGFGLTGTDNVISCGSFTTNGTGNATVNLGYEPQWLLVKNTSATEDWLLIDSMRGWVVGGNSRYLRPNLSNAEPGTALGNPTATGFDFVFSASATYIYIAIRRGPMKVPTSATTVFNPDYAWNTSSSILGYLGQPTDAFWLGYLSGNAVSVNTRTRLVGGNRLTTSSTDAEVVDATTTYWDSQLGFQTGGSLTTSLITWNFRRAPSFFDVVCYSGTASLRTVTHNLGVAPELMIIKSRGTARQWPVYTQPTGNAQALILNLSDAVNSTANDYFNSTSPTSTVFTLANFGDTNQNTVPYVAYLFATCAGVSKVFSYTGNGSSQTINCGFTSSARFVLIKRTDDVGDWYVWDSARGIVSGNDSHLSLNTTAAEVTSDDTIDTDSTGFVVNQVSATNVNVSSATYIGLAIA